MTGGPKRAADLMARAAGLVGPIAERQRERAAVPKRTVPPEDQRAAVDARRRLWAESVDERFKDATLGTLAARLPAETVDAVRSWAEGRARENLVLLGALGAGKTHAAVAAARHRSVMCGETTWCTSEGELLDMLRPNGDPGAMARATGVDVLVLDEIGGGTVTDWSSERLALVVDRRWRDCRPIIATSNLGPGEGGQLSDRLGGRTYSRLVGSGAVVLGVSGPDIRREQ